MEVIGKMEQRQREEPDSVIDADLAAACKYGWAAWKNFYYLQPVYCW